MLSLLPTLLSLAALGASRPAPATAVAGDFSLALQATDYPQLSLNAIPSTTSGVLDLVFERLAAYPGTPAYLNASYVDFELGAAEPYALYMNNVGDDYGVAVPVQAILGQANGKTGFSIVEDQLVPTLDSAEESFFACNSTLGGVPQFSLFWGVFNSNGSSPYGCTPATLIQNFNTGD
ncbi:hypothetical protein B7494_g8510 [Chlorociboria aeruginascens]|nr:hypothetical protein B7494_g8510 [Chlorociboria aeruginascens]